MANSIKLVIGGSPCVYWTLARRDGREVDGSGSGWDLFQHYVSAVKICQPDYFLYENNMRISQTIKDSISMELGVKPVMINSSLVSSQHRKRLYWVGKRVADGRYEQVHIDQPEDIGLTLRDVLRQPNCYPIGETLDGKSYVIKAQYGKSSIRNFLADRFQASGVAVAVPAETRNSHIVSDHILKYNGESYPVNLDDGQYTIRKLTPEECEELQTLPRNYTYGVSNVHRYTGIGNGWTAEVILHLLRSFITANDIDKPYTVVSMFDGIGTGRYCMDKLGVKNITYYAYEIDHNAITIANKNFPDIIQMGDASGIEQLNIGLMC